MYIIPIEKVARAINPWAFVALAEIHQRQAAGERLDQGWVESVAGQVNHSMACARAAIEVMRTPTAAMWDGAIKHMDSYSSNVAWWRAMIDGALGGESVENAKEVENAQ